MLWQCRNVNVHKHGIGGTESYTRITTSILSFTVFGSGAKLGRLKELGLITLKIHYSEKEFAASENR